MMKHLTRYIRIIMVLKTCVAILTLNVSTAWAWTSAQISNVDVLLAVAAEGTSKVTTEARFEIYGGQFHGFDLAPLGGGTLIKDECRAVLDDGRRYPLAFRKLSNGKTRVVLADKASLGRGAVTFTLIHEIDLIEQGALRKYAGRARLDWTPLIWNGGTNLMSIKVQLPGSTDRSPIVADPTVSKDYKVNITADAASFVKFRTIRWYPMQVVMEFDPSLVPGIVEEARESKDISNGALSALAFESPRLLIPMHIAALPAIIVFFGLLLMMRKAWHLNRALADLNINARYKLLPHTQMPARFFLSLAVASLGLAAQYYGSLAASVPALVLATALWIVGRETGSLRTRPGGNWRKMSDVDVAAYQKLATAYRSRRRSWIDISSIGGAFTFVIYLCGLAYFVFLAKNEWAHLAWAIVINGLIWAIPVWFSHVRSELPVDPTIEGFIALRRWRSSLSKLVGSVNPKADASFWIREDDKGTIEVRLRVDSPPMGLNGIEVAGETIRSGSTYRTRKAVILRMEPGTAVARKLATCAYAAEHHLTPDLEEEIVVLRNRRGGVDTGLTPLRSALEML